MANSSTVNILRNLRNLIGEVAFNQAVEALKAEPAGAPELTVKPGKPAKEKKPRKTDPVKTAKRKADMAALQAFIKKLRSEMPEGTPYKEVQAAAGERWKALSDEEKEQWKKEHPYVPSGDSDSEAAAEASDAEKVVTVSAPEPAKKGEVTVTAVKEGAAEPKGAAAEPKGAAAEPKKARGRPKKAAEEAKADE